MCIYNIWYSREKTYILKYSARKLLQFCLPVTFPALSKFIFTSYCFISAIFGLLDLVSI